MDKANGQGKLEEYNNPNQIHHQLSARMTAVVVAARRFTWTRGSLIQAEPICKKKMPPHYFRA
jgi:hypothetical protein